MKVIDSLVLPDNICSAVTIGKFDGIHIGHRILLERIKGKKDEGMKAVCVAFDMGRNTIYTEQESRLLFEKNGVDILAGYAFDDRIRKLSPEMFVKEILVKGLNAGYVCVGDDFRFGYGREGDADTLIRLGNRYGIETDIVNRIVLDGDVVSSSRIRGMLDEGNIAQASSMLGRKYVLGGKVVHGKRLGRTLGFPTVNLAVKEGKYMPANGVYASYAFYNNKKYDAVTNIGLRPTVESGGKPVTETYIFDFDSWIYGEYIEIELICYMRSEIKFPDIYGLRNQIEKDKETARRICEEKKG